MSLLNPRSTTSCVKMGAHRRERQAMLRTRTECLERFGMPVDIANDVVVHFSLLQVGSVRGESMLEQTRRGCLMRGTATKILLEQ